MIRNLRPLADPQVTSSFGRTRDGQSLSHNRAPADDLAGWIARLSVSKLELQGGQAISCGLFADTAALRIQLAGKLVAQTTEGIQHHGPGALCCGPQSRLMPVRIESDLVSIGVLLRPSGSMALTDSATSVHLDEVFSTRHWKPEFLLSLFDPDGTPEQWLTIVEDLFRQRIAELGNVPPNPVTAGFETIAFCNPAQSVAQAARELGVDRRRLERLVMRDFGLSPKQVLKRARALDMASYLRGVADGDEAEALALRYYDESHLIREFVELFGMSPRQFAALPQPLLTLNLEMRQARRLEMMKRLEPGAKRPWE